MKIAVLSDTHGNYALAITMLNHISGLDCIIHLGDIVQDADIIEYALSIPVIKIAGNCDSDPMADRELLLNFCDMSIFLSHGDVYRVKNGIENIYEKATNLTADIVLYGHTHEAAIQKKGEILLVNPGSLKDAAVQQSLAILTITNREVSAEIIVVKEADFPAPFPSFLTVQP